MQKSFVIGPVEEITKAAARRILRERIEQELHLRADSRNTLAWFIKERWQPLRESTWRKSTKTVNEYLLGSIIGRFGNTALEQSDAVALQLWLNQLAKTRSASFVKHIRILLKSIYAEAVEQDYIRKSPARLLRLPQELKPVLKSVLTLEQIAALLAVATGMDRVILRLLLTTGLRPSELFALRWNDFDAENKLLRITESVYRGDLRGYTKTTGPSSRQELTQVYLPDALVTELKEWRKEPKGWTVRRGLKEGDNDFIFANSENGNFIFKENWVHRNLNKMVCEAFHTGKCAKRNSTKCHGENIPKVSFQVLRRTVATYAQGLGSAKDIQTLLRHTKVDTSQDHYIQPMQESVRGTVDKLASLLLPDPKLPPKKPSTDTVAGRIARTEAAGSNS